MLKRTLPTLFCAALAAVAAGVPAALAADPQPAGTATAAARTAKDGTTCAPALGFVAGIVTASEPRRLVIEVKRAGSLGAGFVGGELTVVVAPHTRFSKQGAPAGPRAVELGDRVSLRLLKCRGEKFAADTMKAAAVVDHGRGAAGDAKVRAGAVAETVPAPAAVAALGRSEPQGARGKAAGRAVGQSAPRLVTTTDGDGAAAENAPASARGKGAAAGKAKTAAAGRAAGQSAPRIVTTTDGDGAAAENAPASARG